MVKRESKAPFEVNPRDVSVPRTRGPSGQVREDAALGDESPHLNEAPYTVRFRVPLRAGLFGEAALRG